MQERTTESIVSVYDGAFDERASDRSSAPGDAHQAALRAVYDQGLADGRRP